MNGSLLKYLIIPIVLFLASVLIIFWVLLPMYRDVQVALAVRQQNLDNLAQRKKLSANLAKLIGQYNEKAAEVATFEKAIPVGQNTPELLVNLEALASESGLIFSGVNFRQKDLKATGIKTLAMEVKLKGSYPALLNYLKAVEKSLRLFDTASASFIGIGPGQQGANPNQLEFNLTINTYFQ
jgi:Tfp pilus assembly protein PilO